MAILRTLAAIVRQRCPVCLQGKVFATSTRMNETCPVCQVRFEREQGYFLGAMYISYGMASLILLALAYGGHLIWPHVDLGWMMLAAIVVFIPMVPMVFRYSRILWIAFERWAWP